MIRFGPGGNSDSFYKQGFKSTFQAFKWLKEIGLNAYEYQGGKGLLIKEETARIIGEEAEKYGIYMSLHTPYYINLASPENDKMKKSFEYIQTSVKVAKWMNAKRIVIHPGSQGSQQREKAFERVLAMFKIIADEFSDQVTICPELMGRTAQIGDLSEVMEICKLHDSIIPTIDFGHLNARTQGKLNSEEAFDKAISYMIEQIGTERVRNMHIHFSRIEYTHTGEKRHWTFNDIQFGPDFKHFAPVLVKYNLEPVIISESAGTMAEDALIMKEMYLSEINGNKRT